MGGGGGREGCVCGVGSWGKGFFYFIIVVGDRARERECERHTDRKTELERRGGGGQREEREGGGKRYEYRQED